MKNNFDKRPLKYIPLIPWRKIEQEPSKLDCYALEQKGKESELPALNKLEVDYQSKQQI